MKAMKAIGLEGKPTAPTEGEGLTQRVNELFTTLGPFPHAALVPGKQEKTQSTRMLKAFCGECGYTIRVTQKWIDESGLPECPVHRTRFTLG